MRGNMRIIVYLIVSLFFEFTAVVHANAQQKSDRKPVDGYMVFGNIIARSSTWDASADRNNFIVNQVGGAVNKPVTPSMQALAQAGFYSKDDSYKPMLALAFVRFSKCFLPRTQLYIGRKRLDFGKVNLRCPRNWDYTDRPAVLKSFFGDTSVIGNGVAAEYMLPTSLSIRATLGAWYVNSQQSSSGQSGKNAKEDPLAIKTSGVENEVFSGCIRLLFPFNYENSLELGINGISGFGTHHSYQKDRVSVAGIDFTYERKRKDRRFIYVQGELYQLRRELTVETIDRMGFYLYGGLRITEQWEFGVRHDWTETALLDKNELSGTLWNITRIITPHSKLRLQHYYDWKHEEHTAYAQVVFGVGTMFSQ